MGQSLTKEEELFRRGEFTEALVLSAERAPPTSSASMPTFLMAPVEWETMATLCDSGDSPIMVRSAAAKIDLAASDLEVIEGRDGINSVYCPLVCCCAQLIAADYGVLPWDIASTRWQRVYRVVVDEATSIAANSPIGWMRESHRRMLTLFMAAAEVDAADVRAVKKTISQVKDSLKSSSATGFINRPVISLLLQYCIVSVALRCAQSVQGGSEAAGMLLTAVETIREAAGSVNADVNVAFLQQTLERAGGLLLDTELRDLAIQDATAAQSGAGGKRTMSWSTIADTFVGQQHAVNSLREHFRARFEGLTPSDKPTVVVFFGPSGHGKTELARLIAAAESGVANPEESGHMVLIHMTSFCTRDSIYSLVDPPAAHVGEGLLISALRKQKNAVVVLDEFEKSTADAVQNVWLSAFPRQGMLRSLKDASRSVSTADATFILTCNTMAEVIDEKREVYLAATDERKAAYRDEWSRECRRQLREKFGEPFVARIDSFVPFVPYDVAETRAYVDLQLQHMRAKLQPRHLDVCLTESYLAYLTGQMATRGFHGSRVEQQLQPHLLALADLVTASTGSGATTRKAGIDPEHRMVLHAKPSLRGDSETVRIIGAKALKALGLPGSTALARRWEGRSIELDSSIESNAPSSHPPAATGSVPHKSTSPDALAAPVGVARMTRDSPSPMLVSTPSTGGGGSKPQSPQASLAAAASLRSDVCNADDAASLVQLHTELEVEKHHELHTDRELALERELEVEKAKNLELTKQVETLKATIKQLEAALAVAVAMIVAMLLFLSLFVSLSTLISFVAIGYAALHYFVGNAAFIIAVACRGFVRLVGPAKAAILGAVLCGWLMWHGYSTVRQCAPCQRAPL
jgi:hypothetical protein